MQHPREANRTGTLLPRMTVVGIIYPGVQLEILKGGKGWE